MKQTYHYVVLRLSPDDMRGEVINVGIVLFRPDQKPEPIFMAPLNKLRALDGTWDQVRLAKWERKVRGIVDQARSNEEALKSLSAFRVAISTAVGMFMADTAQEVARNLADIKATYVSNRTRERAQRTSRTRLLTLMREQFKRLQLLGQTAEDVAAHLVVPNMPVPTHPDLKSDFVYKNGVYRITQTVDYNVAPDSMHNKLQEVCVKALAAEMASKTYGQDTKRLAVVDIPDEYAEATDNHMDLLLAKGFEIFHFGRPDDMTRYLEIATPVAGIH